MPFCYRNKPKAYPYIMINANLRRPLSIIHIHALLNAAVLERMFRLFFLLAIVKTIADTKQHHIRTIFYANSRCHRVNFRNWGVLIGWPSPSEQVHTRKGEKPILIAVLHFHIIPAFAKRKRATWKRLSRSNLVVDIYRPATSLPNACIHWTIKSLFIIFLAVQVGAVVIIAQFGIYRKVVVKQVVKRNKPL